MTVKEKNKNRMDGLKRKMLLLVGPFCCFLCRKGRDIWTIFLDVVSFPARFGTLCFIHLAFGGT